MVFNAPKKKGENGVTNDENKENKDDTKEDRKGEDSFDEKEVEGAV